MTASTCERPRPSLLVWLVRGGFGLVLLAVAAWTREPLVVIPALLAALVAFRGCPMCWLFELVERGPQDLATSEGKNTP